MGWLSTPKPDPKYNQLQKENAVIAREQYDDYVKRFEPFQNELNQLAGSDEGIISGAQRDQEMARSQGAIQSQEAARNRSRLGVTMDPGQRAFMEKRGKLDSARSQATAYNKGIDTASGRRDALRQQMLGINRGQANEALGEFATAAQMEGQAGAADLNRRTAKYQQNMSTVSTLGGFAAAALILSSKDKKKKIKKADTKKATDEVMAMDVKNYEYKEGAGPKGKRTGVIAEEAPEGITAMDRTAVNIGDWTAKNTAAIQETMKKVSDTARKVDRLAKRFKGKKS